MTIKQSRLNIFLLTIGVIACLLYMACDYTNTLENRIRALEDAERNAITTVDTFIDDDGDTILVEKRIRKIKNK